MSKPAKTLKRLTSDITTMRSAMDHSLKLMQQVARDHHFRAHSLPTPIDEKERYEVVCDQERLDLIEKSGSALLQAMELLDLIILNLDTVGMENCGLDRWRNQLSPAALQDWIAGNSRLAKQDHEDLLKRILREHSAKRRPM